MALPKGFTDLAAAYNSPVNTFVNIIGLVVDIQQPTRTRNGAGDYMFTLKLLDRKMRDSLWSHQGLTVRFFKRDAASLPQVRHHGDVMLLRDIKMANYMGQPLALCNHQTGVLVFPKHAIPDPNYQIAYYDKRRVECLGVPLDVQKLTLEEQDYVIKLKHDLSSTAASLPETTVNIPTAPSAARARGPTAPADAAPPPEAPTAPAAMRKRPAEEEQAPTKAVKKTKTSSFGPKFKTISEIHQHELQSSKGGVFADLCVLVVKKFPTQNGVCELYVTDHTPNKQLFDYIPPESREANDGADGDEYGYAANNSHKKAWPGPYGHLVLKIELQNPHADFANRTVHEGDLVFLRNVRLKISHAGEGLLEANMWRDWQNPEKVGISKFVDKDRPEIHARFDRKERYWASRRAKVGDEAGDGNKKKMTKTEKKKRKKAEAAVKQRAVDQPIPAAVNTKIKVNRHIRCGHEEVHISPLRDILDLDNERHTNTTPEGHTYTLPFVNAKFRARVRVIDFEPRQLEDFSIPRIIDVDASDDESMDIESSITHEWSFALLLEDASSLSSRDAERMWVTVAHQEAQYLFGKNIGDPKDLREDGKFLAQVREKLCILWGNLEERGESEEVSNLPFECCLMEFGLLAEDQREDGFGWERAYGMFGVTIS